MIDVNEVIEWFREAQENDELYENDLEYATKGEVLEFTSIPTEYVVEVVDSQAEPEYNSYGYRSVDGYVIFSVTKGDETELFRLPIEYQSYEGWSFGVDRIKPTAKQEKVITLWEWN